MQYNEKQVGCAVCAFFGPRSDYMVIALHMVAQHNFSHTVAVEYMYGQYIETAQ